MKKYVKITVLTLSLMVALFIFNSMAFADTAQNNQKVDNIKVDGVDYKIVTSTSNDGNIITMDVTSEKESSKVVIDNNKNTVSTVVDGVVKEIKIPEINYKKIDNGQIAKFTLEGVDYTSTSIVVGDESKIFVEANDTITTMNFNFKNFEIYGIKVYSEIK